MLLALILPFLLSVEPAAAQEYLETEVVTLTPRGLARKPIQRGPGKFVLLLQNHSGLGEATVALERMRGPELNAAVDALLGRRDHDRRVSRPGRGGRGGLHRDRVRHHQPTDDDGLVSWNIPAWNALDEKHQSPDLSALVQEVVDRAGWTADNSIVFVITGSGGGRRVSESFEGEAPAAALLHVEYTGP